MGKFPLRGGVFLLVLLAASSNAKGIVSNAHTLAPEYSGRYDRVIVSLSGPNGFSKQMTIETNSLELGFESLGIQENGAYDYQFQFIEDGEFETVSDPSTGRSNAVRMLSPVKTQSGRFHVADQEFIELEETNENEHPNIDVSNFEVVSPEAKGNVK